ncbi:DUF1508 domain-containing protein [Flavobacterium sp. 5]|uniref:DUF1508 domain-containing protein n=1 Tax=Flavobacterium sp. 5 TaxID=2035199 RepID=UPI000C2B8498|nr:DUF1508 domain-containing protein [Flavobacterium sp. 5]PKB16111.1 hypothetical protein CLU82_1229 [Flavobacterium sp. 5]
MGAFVISKRFDNQYKFVFTSRKGKVIFTSMKYELKFESEEAIEYFKSNISLATFEKYRSAGGKYFFKLLLDGAPFALSRKYTTELRVQKGIDEIVKYASISEILDFSDNDLIFLD